MGPLSSDSAISKYTPLRQQFCGNIAIFQIVIFAPLFLFQPPKRHIGSYKLIHVDPIVSNSGLTKGDCLTHLDAASLVCFLYTDIKSNAFKRQPNQEMITYS